MSKNLGHESRYSIFNIFLSDVYERISQGETKNAQSTEGNDDKDHIAVDPHVYPPFNEHQINNYHLLKHLIELS